MARICVRVKANDHPTDAALTAMRTRLGDVVCVVEDGHVFSLAERTNGQYRIIDVTGVSAADIISITAGVFDGSGNLVKRRAQSLDVANLQSAGFRNKSSITKAQFDSLIVNRS